MLARLRERMFGVFFALFCVGCHADRNQAHAWPEPEKYAELRLGTSGKVQVLICGDTWTGLITPHGFGGNRHGIYCWATLEGLGPTYVDPVFHLNAPIPRARHVGTIRVDREKKRVVIDLKRVVSAPGEPEKLEPSPANGTYPIKITDHDAFLQPE